MRATGNVIHDERFGNEILARAGPSHHYQHPQYRTQEGNRPILFIFSHQRSILFLLVIAPDSRFDNLHIQSDNEPLHVVKPADQNVHYKQQINVRFLEPPPAPEPAPIIIKVRIETEIQNE